VCFLVDIIIMNDIVTYCFFGCGLPSVILRKRYVKFIDINDHNRNC